MSNDVSIFTSNTQVAKSSPRVTGLSTQLKEKRTVNNRRIQANINGTFKKVVNGDQVGEVIRGEFNAIIVDMLPGISRIFYKEKFDPKKEATLPNCWSNDGNRPEVQAEDPQHTNCADCPQNIKGSGDTGGKACRYQRRVALILEGDPSGTIYQFNIPAKSLFGKGVGNQHPFESYVNFLVSNDLSPDTVVTTIAFNTNAETMELVFSPLRELSDEEFEVVLKAQQDPMAKRYTRLTVAEADKVTVKPSSIAAPKPAPVVEDPVVEEAIVEEAVEEPKKRASKKEEAVVDEDDDDDMAALIGEWGGDES